ncbi:MAG: GNAT family N-acetyltransferase, partial [Dehalococcoidia bacterium]
SMAGAFGAVALRDGRMAGYLIGRPWLGRPVLRERSGWVDYAGHAVEADDAVDLYRALYAAVAPRWLERGCFAHYVTLPATDATALDAWYSLGFGRWHIAAVRDVAPPAAMSHAAGVEVHEAGEEDLDVVFRLRRGLGIYHTAAPMFEPYLFDQTELRAETLGRLRDPRHRVLLAVRGGEPFGMLALSAPDPPRMMATTGGIHIDEAFVEVAVRGGGAGSMLLDAALRQARDDGYQWSGVSWRAANLSGSRFWLGNGFRPVFVRVLREVDARIAWARAADR